MGGVVKAIASPLLAVFSPPKVPNTPIIPPNARVRENASAVADRLSQKNGTIANRKTGALGAEPGGKGKMGGQG